MPMPVTGQDVLLRMEAGEMDENVKGSGEDDTVYKQVDSWPSTMTNEPFAPSGQGLAHESTFIPLNLRPLIFSKPNGGIRAANYSVQTGEEFAVEFVQEASRIAMSNSQGRSGLRNVPVHKGNFCEPKHYVYEDLTGILGIGRMESGSNSDISILAGDRGNLSKFGSNCNPAYTEYVQGMQFPHSVNNGLYQSDGFVDPSTCEAEFQPTSFYSMHQSYLSGPSDDSSSGKVKFMCSFGGKILPRPSDGKLRYVGGETRIITVNKDIAYGELMQKMMDIYGQALILKYQLPDEDLDALVSVSSDEDLEHMIEEYDRLESSEGSSRLRVFLFTAVDQDLGHFDAMADRRHSEQCYVDAVNGILEVGLKKHVDGVASASSQHLENLIGLDITEDWSTALRAQEGASTSFIPSQSSHNVVKVINLPGILPCSSKQAISSASPGINSPPPSPPFSSLPIHLKQSTVADSPVQFFPAQHLQGDGHSYSTVRQSEGYCDFDYGKLISSSMASQHDPQYKYTESRTFPDSPTKANQGLLPMSHSDMMYHGERWPGEPKLPRVDLNHLEERFEITQSMMDLKLDGQQHPVDFQQIALQQVPARVYQPVRQQHLDADQCSYKPLDWIPQAKLGGMQIQPPVQQNSMQTAHHNISRLPGYESVLFRHVNQAQLQQDDTIGGTYIDKAVSTHQTGYGVMPPAALQQVDSPPSPHQSGGGQSHVQVQRNHEAPPCMDQHYYGKRVPNHNDQSSRAFHPSTAPCYTEQLPEQFLYQQTLSHEQVAHPEERFARQQALPHVLSDTVLQTHMMKPVHPMNEGIPISQGHHSDSSLRAMPSYGGSSTSQEELMSFQERREIGDVRSQIVHQGKQNQPSGWQRSKATYGSSEFLEEPPSLPPNFHERSDEIGRVLQQKAVEQDDVKMQCVMTTRKEQPEENDEELSDKLLGSSHTKPAISKGGMNSSGDLNTFLHCGLVDSHQAMGILTDASQASQLSARINQVAVPSSGPNAQELGTAHTLKEHATGHHAANVNSQLPTENLAETAFTAYMSTAGVEPCISLSSSETWWVEMGLDEDRVKVEVPMYGLGRTDNPVEDLLKDALPLRANNEIIRPVDTHGMITLGEDSITSTCIPEHHPPQLLGKSLIDDDSLHSAYLLCDILANTKFIDGASSPPVAFSVSTQEDGIHQKVDLSNHDVSKGLFEQPLISVDDKAESTHRVESFNKDISTDLKARGGTLDKEVERETQNDTEDMGADMRPNFFTDSNLLDCEWDRGSEDVRVEENISLGKVMEVADEESITIQDSDTEETKIEDSDKDEPVSDAAIAEAEAIAHGLQIIKYADLEELRELGSGTFGTVYHGKWRGSDVAIKRIKNSCFMGRPSEQERMRADFWREAWMLAHLHHPNVVAFYGVVPDGPGGTLATVTEYMVNGSLKQVLQRRDRTIDRRKRLLISMDAAFGMEYLHGKNIVHFDLKCENLLVNMRDSQRPICKVGDLGLSKIKHQTLVSGGVRGTLPWMAPELLNGSSSRVSEKVDVFSFGIVMWELLTGEEPYANMHYGAIIGGIVNNTLRPPVPNWCDPAWRSLMEQCWSADPAARPSFTEIANQLRATATSLHPRGHGHHAQVLCCPLQSSLNTSCIQDCMLQTEVFVATVAYFRMVLSMDAITGLPPFDDTRTIHTWQGKGPWSLGVCSHQQDLWCNTEFHFVGISGSSSSASPSRLVGLGSGSLAKDSAAIGTYSNKEAVSICILVIV
eukprot:Gb_39555 [translate_table: standard]